MVNITDVVLKMNGNDGEVIFKNEHIGNFHRIPGYPPSATTLSGRRIGGKTPTDVIKSLIAIVQTEWLGGDFSKVNIFPDETWVLRISDVAYDISPDPKIKPNIVAKVHFNSKLSTGSSAASKPATSRTMIIDLDSETFMADGKEQSFANQSTIVKKLKKAMKNG